MATNLGVERGERRIVSGVSFTLGTGEALVVTGENGSGKSTLLRAIAGLLPCAQGGIQFEGRRNGGGAADIDEDARLGEYCHYLGHQNGLKAALSVEENLTFWQKFYGANHAAQNMGVEEALETVGMAHVLDIPAGYLSTGMKRRVAIAKLLLSERPVWIVDEPTAGLDAQSTKMFTDIASDFCKGGGILIAATHLPLGLKKTQKLEIKDHLGAMLS